jgi:hypothetical protein
VDYSGSFLNMPFLLGIGHGFSFPNHVVSIFLTVSGSGYQAPLHDISNLVWYRFKQGIGLSDSLATLNLPFLGAYIGKQSLQNSNTFG